MSTLTLEVLAEPKVATSAVPGTPEGDQLAAVDHLLSDPALVQVFTTAHEFDKLKKNTAANSGSVLVKAEA